MAKNWIDKLSKKKKSGITGIAGLMLGFYILFFTDNKLPAITILTISLGFLLWRWKR